jgi:hypothetical protein
MFKYGAKNAESRNFRTVIYSAIGIVKMAVKTVIYFSSNGLKLDFRTVIIKKSRRELFQFSDHAADASTAYTLYFRNIDDQWCAERMDLFFLIVVQRTPSSGGHYQ